MRTNISDHVGASQVVDLSLTLSPELPCSWPNAVPFRQFVDHWFTDVDDAVQPLHCHNGAPYRAHAVIFDEHTGTHFDAPSHFLEHPVHPTDPHNGDDVPPEQFMGPAAVIDVTALRTSTVPDGHSPRIEPEHVTTWETKHGTLSAGDIVLFRSDWDEHYVPVSRGGHQYVTDAVTHGRGTAWPAPSPATMELLLARGVQCVGTDGASMGPAEDGAPTHVTGLAGGMVFIECLANLRSVPARGAVFVFLPVKIARSSGGPGRAVAFVHNGGTPD